MFNLFDALVTKFDDDGNLSSYVLYLDNAEPNATLPYFVVFLIDDVPEYDLSSLKPVENCSIQFNIFSDKADATEIKALYGHLTGCYDECSLAVSDYYHIRMKREMTKLLKDEHNRWQASVGYAVWLQKT